MNEIPLRIIITRQCATRPHLSAQPSLVVCVVIFAVISIYVYVYVISSIRVIHSSQQSVSIDIMTFCPRAL